MVTGRGSEYPVAGWRESDETRTSCVRGLGNVPRKEHGEKGAEKTGTLNIRGWASWLWIFCLWARTESLFHCSLMG